MTHSSTDTSRRTALVLHGGGGPATVAGLAAQLAQTMHVIAPTHPGWENTARPAELTTVGQLADLYAGRLAAEGHRDVLVVGSSIGGWIAAEIALRAAELVGDLVVLDTGGIEVEQEPIRDIFALDPRGVAEYSFHDPQRFYIDPSTLSPEQIATRQANMATLRTLAGDPYMYDPDLLPRLKQIQAPTLVLWGESDRIITPAYGRAFAAAIPGARFTVIPEAGHLPQIEQPAATYAAIAEFARLA